MSICIYVTRHLFVYSNLHHMFVIMPSCIGKYKTNKFQEVSSCGLKQSRHPRDRVAIV